MQEQKRQIIKLTNELKNLRKKVSELHCPNADGFEGPETFFDCGECIVCKSRIIIDSDKKIIKKNNFEADQNYNKNTKEKPSNFNRDYDDHTSPCDQSQKYIYFCYMCQNCAGNKIRRVNKLCYSCKGR